MGNEQGGGREFVFRKAKREKSHKEWNQKVGWQQYKNINNWNRVKATGLNPHSKNKKSQTRLRTKTNYILFVRDILAQVHRKTESKQMKKDTFKQFPKENLQSFYIR